MRFVPHFTPSLWHHGSNLNIDMPCTNNATEGWPSMFIATVFHCLFKR